MNQSTLNEMHAARRNHAMKLAHPQHLLPIIERNAAAADRRAILGPRPHFVGGAQIALAFVNCLLDGAQGELAQMIGRAVQRLQ